MEPAAYLDEEGVEIDMEKARRHSGRIVALSWNLATWGRSPGT
jgi:hypothetical protein